MRSDHVFSIKLRNARVDIARSGHKIKIDICKAVLDEQYMLAFEPIDSFECSEIVGLTGISQAIDMHYVRLKQDLAAASLAAIKAFRAKADICMIEASKVELLMKGK